MLRAVPDCEIFAGREIAIVAEATLEGLRVLVVEDDYFIAADQAQVLERAGAEVVGPVPSVEAALQLLAHRPDVAVLDVHLQDGTSDPLTRHLDQLGVPYVMATAEDRKEPTRAVAWIKKPVAQRDLLAAVEAAARRR